MKRPSRRRLAIGAALAVICGVPLLVAFLYANDGIDVDAASTWAMVAVAEVIWIGGVARWLWRERRSGNSWLRLRPRGRHTLTSTRAALAAAARRAAVLRSVAVAAVIGRRV
jgi:hypothetical protein